MQARVQTQDPGLRTKSKNESNTKNKDPTSYFVYNTPSALLSSPSYNVCIYALDKLRAVKYQVPSPRYLFVEEKSAVDVLVQVTVVVPFIYNSSDVRICVYTEKSVPNHVKRKTATN